MGDIIAEAGLSAGAVYVYYRSKEELIVDAGRKVFEERMAALEKLGQEGSVPPPAHAIPALMSGLTQMDFFPGVAVQVWGEAVRNDRMGVVARTILEQIRGHIEAYLREWLLTTRSSDEANLIARRLAPAVMGLIQGYAIQTALGGTTPARRTSIRPGLCCLASDAKPNQRRRDTAAGRHQGSAQKVSGGPSRFFNMAGTCPGRGRALSSVEPASSLPREKLRCHPTRRPQTVSPVTVEAEVGSAHDQPIRQTSEHVFS